MYSTDDSLKGKTDEVKNVACSAGYLNEAYTDLTALARLATPPNPGGERALTTHVVWVSSSQSTSSDFGSYLIDGKDGTMWHSGLYDNSATKTRAIVDLGQVRSVRKVELKNRTGYRCRIKGASIYTSTNVGCLQSRSLSGGKPDSSWTLVGTVGDSGDAKWDQSTITLSDWPATDSGLQPANVQARCVMLFQGNSEKSACGNSGQPGPIINLQELRVFGAPLAGGAARPAEASGTYTCGTDNKFSSGNNEELECLPMYASCKEIKRAVPSAVSGHYEIDPDGPVSDGGGTIESFEVYCDMSSGSGRTFYYVKSGKGTNSKQDANSCKDQGLMLFSPTNKKHYAAGRDYVKGLELKVRHEEASNSHKDRGKEVSITEWSGGNCFTQYGDEGEVRFEYPGLDSYGKREYQSDIEPEVVNTIDRPGAVRMRVRFSFMDIEQSQPCSKDYVAVKATDDNASNNNNEWKSCYRKSHFEVDDSGGQDNCYYNNRLGLVCNPTIVEPKFVWSDWVEGDSVDIIFKSDGQGIGEGFTIDALQFMLPTGACSREADIFRTYEDLQEGLRDMGPLNRNLGPLGIFNDNKTEEEIEELNSGIEGASNPASEHGWKSLAGENWWASDLPPTYKQAEHYEPNCWLDMKFDNSGNVEGYTYTDEYTSANPVCHSTYTTYLCMATDDRDTPDGEIRLTGNTREEAHRGKVEIFHDGHWGTVCDDGMDNDDAKVICRQLGFPDGNHIVTGGCGVEGVAFGDTANCDGGTSTVVDREWRFSGDTVHNYSDYGYPIWIDGGANCVGNEASFKDCPGIAGNFQNPGGQGGNCAHDEDLGVLCDTGSLESVIAVVGNGTGTVAGRKTINFDNSYVCPELVSPMNGLGGLSGSDTPDLSWPDIFKVTQSGTTLSVIRVDREAPGGGWGWNLKFKCYRGKDPNYVPSSPYPSTKLNNIDGDWDVWITDDTYQGDFNAAGNFCDLVAGESAWVLEREPSGYMSLIYNQGYNGFWLSYQSFHCSGYTTNAASDSVTDRSMHMLNSATNFEYCNYSAKVVCTNNPAKGTY